MENEIRKNVFNLFSEIQQKVKEANELAENTSGKGVKKQKEIATQLGKVEAYTWVNNYILRNIMKMR